MLTWQEFTDAARLVGASAVEVAGGHLDITVWKEGSAERVIRKH